MSKGNKIAFIFPGQGAQYVGMGKDLCDNYESAKQIYNSADNILGKSISTLCFEGPEDSLKQTVNTQPCIVTTSIAAYETLKSELNIVPDYVAGHSLGEYCAMYAAKVMDLETTLNAIQKRADLMSQTKGGTMAAVLNADEEIIKAGIAEGLKYGYVDVANYNSPVQVVITGDENAVKIAGDYILEKGAKRVVPLAVSGAFHSKYMENAAKEFEKFVAGLDLADASIPVITNVDAQETIEKEAFKKKMPEQIHSSVYWTQTIQKMVSDGIEIFVEIGPGKVLAGLNKKIAPEAKVFNIFDKESLENTIRSLREELAEVL